MSAVDCAAVEGTGAGRVCTLTASLSAVSGKQVTVAYATQDGTATAPGDYAARLGHAHLRSGRRLGVAPDRARAATRVDESDETFVFNLSGAQNATLVDAQGLVTIDDDDGPTLTVSSPSVLEGNAGTTQAGFTLSLSAPSVQPVTVSYLTADGTASAGRTTSSLSGTVTFPPGTTGQSVNVPVIGDVLDEPNETFYLNLGPVDDATASAATTAPPSSTTTAARSRCRPSATARTAATPCGRRRPVRHGQPGATSWEVVWTARRATSATGMVPCWSAWRRTSPTVLQSSSAGGRRPRAHPALENATGLPQDGYVRVSSAALHDRLRAGRRLSRARLRDDRRIARFNPVGGQATVVVLQNANAPARRASAFLEPIGALLDSRALRAPARAAVALNASTVPGVGQSGSITVVHDGGYGALAGKAVALDPARLQLRHAVRDAAALGVLSREAVQLAAESSARGPKLHCFLGFSVRSGTERGSSCYERTCDQIPVSLSDSA